MIYYQFIVIRRFRVIDVNDIEHRHHILHHGLFLENIFNEIPDDILIIHVL